uniref:Putative receptor-like protein kinase At5g24010 n=1 Tax=Anthurium amnicola TaxID=1678845 RepID=A0A1D1Y9B8_9ARAE
MVRTHCLMVILPLLGILSSYQFSAQSTAQPPIASGGAARSLDALLQDYAYRAFNQPRTGERYDADVPSNISGIKISVMRLRSGSFWRRGVLSPGFHEFVIPDGVIEQPYVERLALVYQNLGNWSSVYYQLPGYTFVAPVLGLLAYEATNLSATNLPELDIVASKNPISIKFTDVDPAVSGVTTKCVWFNLEDGQSQLNDTGPDNVCTTYGQGHFSIVVNSSELAPAPAPSLAPAPSPGQVLPPSFSPPGHTKKNRSNTWKIVGAVVGGFLALILLTLLVLWIKRYRQNKNMKKMIQHAESGEVLQKHRIGDAQLPTASVVRTRPTLENELVPQTSATQ